MEEAARGLPENGGPHHSCNHSEGCCSDETACGPVYRKDSEMLESQRTETKNNGRNGAKFILREMSTGSPFMVPGGPSSNFYFAPKKETAKDTSETGR